MGHESAQKDLSAIGRSLTIANGLVGPRCCARVCKIFDSPRGGASVDVIGLEAGGNGAK